MANEAIAFELWDIEKVALKPPELFPAANWAGKHIVLLKETTREPGPYRVERAPYQRDILNLYQHPDVRHIVLKWATQLGKTLLVYVLSCFIIDQDPYSIQLVYATDSQGREISRTRLQKMFEACDVISKKIPSDKTKYQLLEMVFPGMIFYITGANSPTPISQKPCRNLFRDEVNKWPSLIGDFGNPMELTTERLKSFWDIRKIFDVSSPTTEEGNITREEGDCQVILKYYVPCPFCGRLQYYDWDQIVYEDREDLKRNDRIYIAKSTAYYKCRFCNKEIDDTYRDWMLSASNGAGWFDMSIEEPESSPDPINDLFKAYEEKNVTLESVASRLSSIYSPWLKFGDIVEKHMKAELAEVDRLDKRRTFINDWLGEEYVQKVEVQSEDSVLKHKCELTPLLVHPAAVALTAGIDPHKNHIEFIIRAWARDYRNWLVRYGVLFSWDELWQIIFEDVYPIDGIDDHMMVWRAAMDTGGSDSGEEDKTATEEAYSQLRDHGRGVIFGVKGSSSKMATRVRQTIIEKMPGRKGRLIPGGLIVWQLDTGAFKETIQYRLQIEDEGPQYFYMHSETGKDYVRQLTAEEQRYDKSGRLYWHKKRANHYLDCEVYAAACADPQWWGGVRVLRGRAKPKEKGNNIKGRRVIHKGIEVG